MFSLFNQFRNYETQRKKLLAKAPTGPLKDYLAIPFPEPNTNLQDVEILAVDFETTGLDPKKDKLLSVGFVEIQQLSIPLHTSYHQLIRTEDALKAENVIIHQITDDAKDAGDALAEVVEALLIKLAGKAMLAHYHKIEFNFLNQACILLYGCPIIFPIIDTLYIQKKHWDKRLVAFHPSQLKLSNLRDHYGLPHHKAHNALTDALATGELFLAQMAEYQHKRLNGVLSN